MACGTCAYWRECEDGEKRCWAFVVLCGETDPCDVDPWDQVTHCEDWTPKN